LAGQRANHIVGLDAIDHQDGHAKSAHGGVDRLDLHAQLVRHRRAVRLVFGIKLVAKSLALGVKNAGNIVGRRFLAQAFEHVHKAVQRVGRRAVGGGKILDRVEGAVEIRRTVDEQQGRHVATPFSILVGRRTQLVEL
jgi:hypothetical protein